jgi:hypothetical protein
LQGRPEHLGDGDAQERRGDVGAVVDVLCEQEVLVGVAAPDQPHGVHVEQQAGGAAVVADLGVVGVGGAEAQVERLELVRVLVEQVAQVARRAVGGGDRQQHGQLGTAAVATACGPGRNAPTIGTGRMISVNRHREPGDVRPVRVRFR